jgi:hypothetical protein
VATLAGVGFFTLVSVIERRVIPWSEPEEVAGGV